MLQIKKPQARRLYNNKKDDITICPSGLSFDHEKAITLKKEEIRDDITFDEWCDNYTKYNCNRFDGGYIKFYIKE